MIRASHLAAALLLTAGSAQAAAPSVHLVPAEDVALSAVMLIGKGLEEPVLLADARDQATLENTAAEWKGKVECRHRASAHRAAIDSMSAVADHPCEVIDDLASLARQLWPQPTSVVVVSEDDYTWLLTGASFAGVVRAALLPLKPGERLGPAAIEGWTKLETVYVTPGIEHDLGDAGPRLVALETSDAVLVELERVVGDDLGDAVVVANPKDPFGFFSPSALSLVSPLVSAVHRAPLLLVTTADSDAIEAEVLTIIDRHGHRPTHIILVGDEIALRSHRIPDPVLAAGGPEARGGGTIVRAELFSEIQREQPQDFAVGRIVAEDAAQASALLARQLHRRNRRTQRPVVFLTNADSIFALGETISRTTVRELNNLGVSVRAYYRGEVTPEITRQTMLQTDVLVWEGHPRDLTLEERGGIGVDTAPEIAILQGCYTLDRNDPMILIEKGTEAIVATSAAIYSAPGSAFARALFDSALYDGADLGTAVRNARNYLLALAQLQRERGHDEWHKTYRAALAFALWGDPTLKMPLKVGRPSVKPIQWDSNDGDLTLTIPRQRLREVAVDRYIAKPVPRTMYGGLILIGSGPKVALKDLYFNVRSAPPEERFACRPDDAWNVISLYAPRTGTLSVLARPDWDAVADGGKRSGTFSFELQPDAGACVGPTRPPEEDESERL